MSTTEHRRGRASGAANTRDVDLKFEVIVLPVSDVARAKDFYGMLGWRPDADLSAGGFRLIQMTPPGSSCSVQFGTDLTSAAPGSAEGYLVVSDIEVARDGLVAQGVDVSAVFHEAMPGARFPGVGGRLAGPAPSPSTYGSFAVFNDPDGNRWLLQEVTARAPGRIDPTETSFGSIQELARAMERAEKAHGEHEKRTGMADQEWAAWYARYMVAEQAGTELPE
jgi:predicted enzyme related to lactoylglutathione lyase